MLDCSIIIKEKKVKTNYPMAKFWTIFSKKNENLNWKGGENMTKFLKKQGAKILGLFGVIGGSLLAKATLAATDTDLTNAIASTTAIIGDNKGEILTFIAYVFGAVLIITLVIVALNWAIRRIAGAFGTRRRK